MDRRDIAEVLFSSIKEDDPYRASKLIQIERWCYASWKIHAGYGEIRNNFLARVLSSEDCWEKVNNLHGVKLNGQMVGKKLIAPSSDSNPNPFGTARYKIACDCCLEEDIRAIFEERKEELLAQGRSSLLEYKHLVKCCGEGPLAQFWSHFISGYLDKLDLRGRHPYEYGLYCAIDWKRAEAVEFFWNKIKSLPENEMSAQKKDEILMKNAIYAAGPGCGVCPDMFEFLFNQINPDKYPELLKRDLEKNGHYGSLNRMIDMLSFDKFQKLFDYLQPGSISENSYHTRLYSIRIQDYSGYYVDAAKKLFMHIWIKEGFDSHRALVINEEVMDSSFSHTNLLVRWVKKSTMEPVWAVLDKLDSNQIKEFMSCKQADYIRSILEQGDQNLLNRFLAYGKSADEKLDQKNIPGPSGDLAEVEISKQSYVGLSDH
ncbi:hypothetical protein [Wolbachia endosymbiont (group B) of Gerris lacustris]|uniref:hypothetical protein n=1 Tax=Wolbachia endosymbiont (group B) of Gerris lacustris TaxID=3066159 RepID=UPI003342CB61